MHTDGVLKAELAVVIDLREQCKSCYKLEGDGPLVVDSFETIVHLHAVIHSSLVSLSKPLQVFHQFNQPPNTAAVVHQNDDCILPGHLTQQQWYT